MTILLIGQSTLHWGRMEFGNMGNYYIIEPFIRCLHMQFPDVEIKTTLQMSKEFCTREKVQILPMEYYYGFRENDLEMAKADLQEAENYLKGICKSPSGYVKEVLQADLVIDLSGDMWGDNADLAGKDRFEVGLIRDYIPQILGKPTFMLAGSPGPFEQIGCLEFAHQVFSGFSLVTNREKISRQILIDYGFDVSNVVDCACPSFLFEANRNVDYHKIVCDKFAQKDKPVVGVILCGWNFKEVPFSKWPREDKEYEIFINAIEKFVNNQDVNLCLISHSNGFPIPPACFELQHGRDYFVLERLYQLLRERNNIKNTSITLINEVLDVWDTKGIIGKFDMLISGRVHGAIAGLSQCVPTVIVDYGQEPKAHKLKGFAEIAGVSEYVADPNNLEDMENKIERCWGQRSEIRGRLEKRMPIVFESAVHNFEMIKEQVCDQV